MDNIVNHLAPTLMGLLQKQVMEEHDSTGVLIRRQEIIGPGRFTMLIRCVDLPTRHLCGYVLTIPEVGLRMKQLSNQNAIIPVTYAGFGTREIGWRWFNSSRKLTTQGKLTQDGEHDFWVGFDLANWHGDGGEAIKTLAVFEKTTRFYEESRP